MMWYHNHICILLFADGMPESTNLKGWNMVSKSELLDYLKISMKNMGYKKQRNTFVKQCDEVFLTITIQTSQFDSNDFQVVFGVSPQGVCEKMPRSAAMCEIRTQLSAEMFTDNEHILYAIKLWEEKYGSIVLLKKAAISGNLPVQSSKSAVSFLTSFNS